MQSLPPRYAIEALNREFEACFAARDAQRLVANYFVEDSEEPLASPPGGVQPVRGRAALVAMFTAQFADIRTIHLESLNLEADEHLLFELGRAHLTLNSGEKAFGRYAVLFRKKAGQWRAKIDFFAPDGWSS